MFFAPFALLAASTAFAATPSTTARPAPKMLSAQPNQDEGAKVLASFRNVGIQGSYWMQFDLRVMPRRGPERTINGVMFGTQGRQGPLTKIVTTDPANTGGNRTQIYLLHGGANPAAWEWNAGQRGITGRRVEDSELLAPIEETDLTLFDLQMPFLRWNDFVYEGVANVRGRPAHAFILYPPAPLEAPVRGGFAPAAVRVFLDTQFSAMTQAEWLDAAGKTQKSVTVLDLKKSGDQWIVKSIDLRNHETRAKTRFAARAVALGLTLPARMFEPDEIHVRNPEVPPGQIERF